MRRTAYDLRISYWSSDVFPSDRTELAPPKAECAPEPRVRRVPEGSLVAVGYRAAKSGAIALDSVIADIKLLKGIGDRAPDISHADNDHRVGLSLCSHLG